MYITLLISTSGISIVRYRTTRYIVADISPLPISFSLPAGVDAAVSPLWPRLLRCGDWRASPTAVAFNLSQLFIVKITGSTSIGRPANDFNGPWFARFASVAQDNLVVTL